MSLRHPYVVYILQCADGSYTTGMTSNLEVRVAAHRDGLEPKAYTYSRRPVVLVWSEEVWTHDEAFHCERRIKGWSRAKKDALIREDLDEVHRIVRREWEAENEEKGLKRAGIDEASSAGLPAGSE